MWHFDFLRWFDVHLQSPRVHSVSLPSHLPLLPLPGGTWTCGRTCCRKRTQHRSKPAASHGPAALQHQHQRVASHTSSKIDGPGPSGRHNLRRYMATSTYSASLAFGRAPGHENPQLELAEEFRLEPKWLRRRFRCNRTSGPPGTGSHLPEPVYPLRGTTVLSLPRTGEEHWALHDPPQKEAGMAAGGSGIGPERPWKGPSWSMFEHFDSAAVKWV